VDGQCPESVAPHQISGVVAKDTLDRGAQVRKGAVGADDGDAIGGVPHERAEALLAATHGALRPFTRGDVGEGHDGAREASVLGNR